MLVSRRYAEPFEQDKMVKTTSHSADRNALPLSLEWWPIMASNACRWNGDTPLTKFHGGTKNAALRAIKLAQQRKRDAERYADWESRGKPPSPSLAPRRDRMRPRAHNGRDPLRMRLYDAQRGLCGICCALIQDVREGTIDHVLPRALGGKNAANVLLAHYACNNAKADRAPTIRELQMLAIVNGRLASADTRPEGGDALAAPFTSGAVPDRADARTQSAIK